MGARFWTMIAGLLSSAGCIGYEWRSTGETKWTVGYPGSGATGLWILANVSYAGMRAQSHPSERWRAIAFLLGLPGTLLTYFVVHEGSGSAYGIRLPRPPGDRGEGQ